MAGGCLRPKKFIHSAYLMEEKLRKQDLHNHEPVQEKEPNDQSVICHF